MIRSKVMYRRKIDDDDDADDAVEEDVFGGEGFDSNDDEQTNNVGGFDRAEKSDTSVENADNEKELPGKERYPPDFSHQYRAQKGSAVSPSTEQLASSAQTTLTARSTEGRSAVLGTQEPSTTRGDAVTGGAGSFETSILGSVGASTSRSPQSLPEADVGEKQQQQHQHLRSDPAQQSGRPAARRPRGNRRGPPHKQGRSHSPVGMPNSDKGLRPLDHQHVSSATGRSTQARQLGVEMPRPPRSSPIVLPNALQAEIAPLDLQENSTVTATTTYTRSPCLHGEQGGSVRGRRRLQQPPLRRRSGSTEECPHSTDTDDIPGVPRGRRYFLHEVRGSPPNNRDALGVERVRRGRRRPQLSINQERTGESRELFDPYSDQSGNPGGATGVQVQSRPHATQRWNQRRPHATHQRGTAASRRPSSMGQTRQEADEQYPSLRASHDAYGGSRAAKFNNRPTRYSVDSSNGAMTISGVASAAVAGANSATAPTSTSGSLIPDSCADGGAETAVAPEEGDTKSQADHDRRCRPFRFRADEIQTPTPFSTVVEVSSSLVAAYPSNSGVPRRTLVDPFEISASKGGGDKWKHDGYESILNSSCEEPVPTVRNFSRGRGGNRFFGRGHRHYRGRRGWRGRGARQQRASTSNIDN